MTSNKAFCVIPLSIIFSFILSTVHISFADGTGTPCLACHGALKEAKNLHAPLAMGCDACHKAVEGKSHPSKGSMVLIHSMPSLCYSCHEESKFKGSAIHKPVDSGMCTACHNPHSSNSKKLLRSEPPDVCYTCHDKAKFTRKYPHKVINLIGCVTCHNPHASNNPSLLTNPINDVCINCHKKQGSGLHVISLPGKKFHPIKDVIDISTLKMIKTVDPKNPKREIEMPDPKVPGKKLSCASCHDPHSSDYPKLFPVQRICLKCHKY
jgi:predicted CXXCH cytochrome family protein